MAERSHYPCAWCGEELGEPCASGAHDVCLFRMVVGSVAHLEHRCSCYLPGATETDAPGLTKREAAEATVIVWQRLLDSPPLSALDEC